MKVEQLITDLIKKGESEQLEFKEIVRKEDIAKSLCAFLNADGGTVLIGVKDDGTVIGIKDSDKHEAELKNYLVKTIIPEAPITISSETINNKIVLLTKVWKGSKPPYLFDGIIYFRKVNHTIQATPNDISKLIIERQKTELHWERQPAIGIDIEDLDELEIRKTLQDITKYGRGKEFSEKQMTEFLTYYGLFHNGNLTNAAVVLFAKEPTRYLPQCRVRLTVFQDSKSSGTFIHDRIMEGNLFRNIEEILQFFEVNIAVKSKFSEKKWLREDVPFPRFALREGLMNALIHRDYSSVSGTAIVAFYPGHLEITNSGELFGGYTPIDLTRNHLSVPRNPDIAHICFLRKMIEKIGRGTINMIEDCESKGYPKPEWLSKSGVTTLTFPKVKVIAKTDDAVSDAVSDAVNDAVKEKLTELVKVRLIEIVNFIDSNKGNKVSDLVKRFNVSERTIKDNLKLLMDVGLIIYKGSKKTGTYELSQNMRNKIARLNVR